MTTTGPAFPSANAQVGNPVLLVGWNNPDNLEADDASNCTCNHGDLGGLGFGSLQLVLYGFDLSAIPDTDIILGLTVTAEGNTTDGGGAGITVNSVTLTDVAPGSTAITGSAALTNGQVAFPDTTTIQTYGGVADSAGVRLIGSQVKDAAFGIVITSSAAGVPYEILNLDYVTLTVTHSPLGSLARNTLASTRLVGGGGLV